ncbi:TRC40/GET3/ArsA family transport-energizing ATPase [Oscillochloris sp. ZM17-4]|uniref:ArsA family ATPase n=1 Tax=Oscillochloris sp. ZM17-4 TaxID=2866714 RepID=UPI001C7305D5|nr:TRC40/GET3/ArsA family transport-energizing ATPase [Oscillochloris sp. ZM17-4]MBX0330801.1 TRC40/GET3/ArsA family transport-energizing ATPase [Oscillochloris sp. ZM17-4]
MRTLIFTGKGGVGKTSVAAATALRAADMGLRTLIMSTDPAHSLADSLDLEGPLGPEPVHITPTLDALEVSIYHDIESNWGIVREHFSQLMAEQGVQGILADEMSVLPGMEEAFPLIRITKHKEAGDYDLLVIDCAPTGETLRLLSAPETFKWAMGMLRGAEKFVIKPLLRPMSKINPMLGKMIAPTEVYEAVDNMFEQMVGVTQTLTNPLETSVRLVMNPEKMVIKESQRAFTYLSMYGMTVDTVVVNKILPVDQDSGYLNHWKDVQQRYLQEVQHSFNPLPIYHVPYYAEEVVGLEKLRVMGLNIYGDTDPTALVYKEAPLDISKVSDGNYQVKIRLPFANVSQLDLFQNGDELVVQIGDFRRILTLPVSLAGLEAGQAEMEDDWLIVPFSAAVGVAQ